MNSLVARLLAERGITDTETFLHPDYTTRPSAFQLPDMQVAVERIVQAIERMERIAVWHDYDCDGIPGGSLLGDFFIRAGYPVTLHAAERSEGYGLNEQGIRMLADAGHALIITVDCGITENEMVTFAQSLGIDVIVTDHHQPSEVLPACVAVINPHRVDSVYPEKVLCGTGVAFKLVEALIEYNAQHASKYFAWTVGQEKWLLDLVAIATVADMVPLVGENRVLVHYGLTVLRKGKRPGIAALLARERVALNHVTEEDISFTIAPKINASSRMESPRLGVELLLTADERRADQLALKLIALNKERKVEGARVAKEVRARMDGAPRTPLMVFGNTTWRPALLGIAANNIVESHQTTVCLWGQDGDLIKGSCRSNGSVSIFQLFTHAGHALTDFGGHEMSGGFTITRDQIFGLEAALTDAYVTLTQSAPASEPRATYETSGTLTLGEVTDATYRALRTMAPFGVGNVKPIFRFARVTVARVTPFGKGSEHVRMRVEDATGAADVIAFFVNRLSCKETVELLSPGDVVAIDGSIEHATFAGRTELRLRLVHVSLGA